MARPRSTFHQLVWSSPVIYNDVLVDLAESDHDKRLEGIRTLNIVEALHPRAVVAGHKRAGRADNPTVIEETRAYISEIDRIAENASTAEELYERMLSCIRSGSIRAHSGVQLKG
jgi:hypothetical protein